MSDIFQQALLSALSDKTKSDVWSSPAAILGQAITAAPVQLPPTANPWQSFGVSLLKGLLGGGFSALGANTLEGIQNERIAKLGDVLSLPATEQMKAANAEPLLAGLGGLIQADTKENERNSEMLRAQALASIGGKWTPDKGVTIDPITISEIADAVGQKESAKRDANWLASGTGKKLQDVVPAVKNAVEQTDALIVDLMKLQSGGGWDSQVQDFWDYNLKTLDPGSRQQAIANKLEKLTSLYTDKQVSNKISNVTRQAYIKAIKGANWTERSPQMLVDRLVAIRNEMVGEMGREVEYAAQTASPTTFENFQKNIGDLPQVGVNFITGEPLPEPMQEGLISGAIRKVFGESSGDLIRQGVTEALSPETWDYKRPMPSGSPAQKAAAIDQAKREGKITPLQALELMRAINSSKE